MGVKRKLRLKEVAASFERSIEKGALQVLNSVSFEEKLAVFCSMKNGLW